MPKSKPEPTRLLTDVKPDGSVTLIDVARAAGVAPMTVSRALHRPELVKEATRLKVQQAVRETGYVPNMLAGSLASNRSRLVAVLLPTIASSVFSDTVQALMDGLSVAGYQTLIGLTGYAREREEELIESLLRRRPDAIVLVGTDHSALSRELLARARIPVVEIWDHTAEPLDLAIGFSHEAVGHAVARYLAACDCRRCAVISVDDPRGLRRSEAFVAEWRRLGLRASAPCVLPSPATFHTGRAGLARLLEGPQAALDGPPEVVFCSSDTIAAGVVQEAAARGIAVPAQLGVMGFGDLSLAAALHPALSTVRVDGAGIGARTAAELLQRFAADGAASAPRAIDTGFEIVARGSTRAPLGGKGRKAVKGSAGARRV